MTLDDETDRPSGQGQGQGHANSSGLE